MDPELEELLTAWLSGEIEPARSEALLHRLAKDSEFRADFIRETRLLGMLKAVQSTEPRWLRLEEELRNGRAADEMEADISLDARVLAAIRHIPTQLAPNWWKRAALLSGFAVIVLLLFVWLGPTAPSRTRKISIPPRLALVVKDNAVTWEPSQEIKINEGSVLSPGWLRLHSGQLTLSFLNGVVMKVEGPAELELISMDRVYCTSGKTRVIVPHGAGIKDFTVSAPGAAVVDLGTDFGFNVRKGSPSRVMVFQGATEVSVLCSGGTTVRSLILAENSAAEIDLKSTAIRTITPAPGEFLDRPKLTVPPLCLPKEYANAVRATNPWGYWRFETAMDNSVANEISGRPALLMNGSVSIAEETSGNHSARFQPDDNDQSMELEKLWTPPAHGGFAVEFLFASEQYKDCAMAVLVAGKEGHHMIVELTAREPEHLLHSPGTLRFLLRQPPAKAGGVNLFSSDIFFPYHWHHIVAQREGSQIELFIDGVLANKAQVTNLANIGPCEFVLGRLRAGPMPEGDNRAFVGRMDEVALYDHTLSVSEIQRHSYLAHTTQKK